MLFGLMADWLESLKLLADPTRLRLMAVLSRNRLSVAEIQEALGMGQSRISTHLGLLRKGGLLSDRREGKNIFYGWASDLPQSTVALIGSTLAHAGLAAELKRDRENLSAILRRRRAQTEAHFNAVAGRMGKGYCPGRSWRSVAHLLLGFVPPVVVADLGAGEGDLSQLLARRCKHVIAIDMSAKMVAFGKQQARAMGLKNLEYRQGDIEDPPIDAASVDIAMLSQALHHAANPETVLRACHRILRPGGTLLILDLKQHQLDAARELYSDTWLGFREAELVRWATEAGFDNVEFHTVEREEKPPHFQSFVLAARRPSNPSDGI